VNLYSVEIASNALGIQKSVFVNQLKKFARKTDEIVSC